ncbi:hypothetical protein B0T20DRAFT_416220 [Sordaria brevicollis]|uniref:Uncharacterized protein n=1 Tax=Sordaria brevicollis TaxID=83679 RepID=A0AAE0PCK3_SORBR|nr:hypothetical protein B0T20DRAFT_416220 [Sordaria brevicollis]
MAPSPDAGRVERSPHAISIPFSLTFDTTSGLWAPVIGPAFPVDSLGLILTKLPPEGPVQGESLGVWIMSLIMAGVMENEPASRANSKSPTPSSSLIFCWSGCPRAWPIQITGISVALTRNSASTR